MSRTKPPARPEVIVIPHRPGRMPRGFGPPMIVMALAVAGLMVRAMSPDWRGLGQEAGGRIRSLFASRPAPPATPKLNPKPIAPSPDLAVAVKPGGGAAKAAPVRPGKAPAAWDDIRRQAEKAKADREAAERIKAEADRALANAPIPPPRRDRDAAGPAAMRRRQEAIIRQMRAHMAEQERQFERMLLAQRARQERFLREFPQAAPRGFGGRRRMTPPPPLPFPFDDFARPLPGMDRMAQPLPGQPRIEDESGEDVRDGMRRAWRARMLLLGPNGFGG